MVWCDLHGVVLKQLGGPGSVHTSDSINAVLNFTYAEYEAWAYTRPLLSST